MSQLPQQTGQTVESQYIQQPSQMSIKPQPITFYPPSFTPFQNQIISNQNYQMQQQQQQQLQQPQQIQQAQQAINAQFQQQPIQLQYGDDQQIKQRQLSQNLQQQIMQQQWNEQFQQMLQMHHHNYLLQNQLHNLMINSTNQSEQARRDLMIQQQQSMADFTNLQPETITEYIPVEKKIIEYETRIKKIQVPVTHEITEYVPVTTETISPERTVRLSPPKEVHMVPTVVQQPPILQQTVIPRPPQIQMIHPPTQITRMPTLPAYQQAPLTSLRSQSQSSPPRVLNKPTEIPIPPPPPHLPLQPFNYTPKDFPTMNMPSPPQQLHAQIQLNSPLPPPLPPPQFDSPPPSYPHQFGNPQHQLPSHLIPQVPQIPSNQFNQHQLNPYQQQHQMNPNQPYQPPLLPHPPQSRPAPFIPEQYHRDQIEDEQDQYYYEKPQRKQPNHPDFQQTKHGSQLDTPNYHIPNYDSENIRDKQSEPIQHPKRAPFIPKSYDPDLYYEKPEQIHIPSKDNQKRDIQRQVYEKRPQNAHQQTLKTKENYFKDTIFQ
ncbi:unnamed protein product [Paramecium primaurelia]|uniref:Uncharacterized protein n=1 Tax=Paramecium primaurelia TaxID=5886 RepID=A0A8S1N0W5_PARPR|nr:unnamed protein product [Paramecium primaurelia]